VHFSPAGESIMIAKMFFATVLLTLAANASASDGLILLAKKKIPYVRVVFSQGNAYDYNDFFAYGVNSLADRCLLRPAPGTAANYEMIQVGEQITLAWNSVYNPASERKMNFKLLNRHGRQFGAMTCLASENAPAPATLHEIKRFLQNQFGASAEINYVD
jgi:hypothetical protein